MTYRPPNRLLAISTPTITGSISTHISSGIINTTTESDVFSLTIPAAQVAAGDVLICEYALDLFNDSGSAVTYQFRAKLGTSTIMGGTAISYASNAARYRASGRITIVLASLTDQRSATQHLGSGANSAGALLVVADSHVASSVTTENLATDKTLSVTVQMGTATASADCRPLMATLTRMR